MGHSAPVTDCAISPDGAFVASVGWDRTFRVWEAEGGQQVAAAAPPGPPLAVALHPWLPLAVCGGHAILNMLEIEGLRYGPLIVAPTRERASLKVRCPRCRWTGAVAESLLGQEVWCRNQTCGIRLRLASFALRRCDPAVTEGPGLGLEEPVQPPPVPPNDPK